MLLFLWKRHIFGFQILTHKCGIFCKPSILVERLDAMVNEKLVLNSGTSEEFFTKYYGRVFGAHDRLLEDMRDYLARPLSVSFRVNTCMDQSQELVEFLEHDSNARKVGWSDDAWELRYGDSNELYMDPSLYEWREFLAKNQASGLIERQELVSMLPVTLLRIKPKHRVLDMCASPGSKSIQALNALNLNRKKKHKGFLMANELDAKRARILIHRFKNLGNGANDIVGVVNHNAKTFPTLEHKFDRIICDVPCSGDGTLRKNLGLWSHWVPHYGMQLHSTQLQIALRGLSLLEVGGRMAYSTCSLNPLENEAVVSAILQKCGDSITLLDCRETLETREIRTFAGLDAWDVVDDTGMIFKSLKQAQTRSKPSSVRHRFRETMFPPQGDESESIKMQLKHCIRVLPHMNNTGGFFVALFEKTKELPNPKKRKASDENKTSPRKLHVVSAGDKLDL